MTLLAEEEIELLIDTNDNDKSVTRLLRIVGGAWPLLTSQTWENYRLRIFKY